MPPFLVLCVRRYFTFSFFPHSLSSRFSPPPRPLLPINVRRCRDYDDDPFSIIPISFPSVKITLVTEKFIIPTTFSVKNGWLNNPRIVRHRHHHLRHHLLPSFSSFFFFTYSEVNTLQWGRERQKKYEKRSHRNKETHRGKGRMRTDRRCVGGGGNFFHHLYSFIIFWLNLSLGLYLFPSSSLFLLYTAEETECMCKIRRKPTAGNYSFNTGN